MKSLHTPSDFSQCNLSVYLSHTWCYGVYSPTSVQTIGAKNILDNSKETSMKQTPQHAPNLVSQPFNAYTQNTAAARNYSEITHESVKPRICNFNPLEERLAPQVIQITRSLPVKYKSAATNDVTFIKSSHGENPLRNTFMEKDSDFTDMALAKHFLQEEVHSRHKLHNRIRLLSEKLSQ